MYTPRKKHPQQSSSYFTHPLTLLVIFLRVGAALSLFLVPVEGYIATVVFDWVDAMILLHIVHITRKQYQYFDKMLDLVSFVAMLLVGIRYGMFWPLLFFFVYRLIGYWLYMRTHDQRYFVYFPNFFEVVFLWTVVGKAMGITDHLVPSAYWTWLVVLFLLKELHEAYIHLYLVDLFKKKGVYT